MQTIICGGKCERMKNKTGDWTIDNLKQNILIRSLFGQSQNEQQQQREKYSKN